MRVFAILFSVLALSVLGQARMARRRPHHELAVRAPSEVQVYKRFTDARWTFFAPGLGACGGTNSETDFIVALNVGQWDGGAHCGKPITMSYGGKTTVATIVDQCPGCPHGGLDLSPALFTFFASKDLGVLAGEWTFGASADTGTKTLKPAPAPAPTTTPAPSSTQTHTRFHATSLASAEVTASALSVLDFGDVEDTVGNNGDELEVCDDDDDDEEYVG